MKAKKKQTHVMVPAPDGHHWMNDKGRYFLMPHKGEFIPHDGAALEMPFKVITTHPNQAKRQ